MIPTTGNDLYTGGKAKAATLAAEMDGLRNYWDQWGVDVVYINVVPPAWHGN